jgi:predicted ATP-dependent endonuclease of OLD family
MLLNTLEIKNYRSLEDVKLEGFKQLNVLIGRNNSGKSSIFSALQLLHSFISGRPIDFSVLTSQDRNRSLEMRLLFDMTSRDRREFLTYLQPGANEDRLEVLYDSPLLRQLEFGFKIRISQPNELDNILGIRSVRMLAEDGEWAVIHDINPAHDYANQYRMRAVRLGVKFNAAPLERLSAYSLDVHTSADVRNNIMQNSNWNMGELDARLFG